MMLVKSSESRQQITMMLQEITSKQTTDNYDAIKITSKQTTDNYDAIKVTSKQTTDNYDAIKITIKADNR